MKFKKALVLFAVITIVSNCFTNMASADVDTSKIPNTNRSEKV